MVDTQRLPADPLGFIQGCVQRKQVFWTYHVSMRMKVRSVSRPIILESVASYEIIEAYPEDKYLPSYLVYARHHGVAFHILFAADVEGDNVRVVTAYCPEPTHWNTDLKTRR